MSRCQTERGQANVKMCSISVRWFHKLWDQLSEIQSGRIGGNSDVRYHAGVMLPDRVEVEFTDGSRRWYKL